MHVPDALGTRHRGGRNPLGYDATQARGMLASWATKYVSGMYIQVHISDKSILNRPQALAYCNLTGLTPLELTLARGKHGQIRGEDAC